MNSKPSSWYAFSDESKTALRCAACHSTIDLGFPQLDHHPSVCPRCGLECAFLNWKGRMVQLVPSKAPAVIQLALRFAQQQFDELEYVEFVIALQELMDELYTADIAAQGG
jgi:hypothetical protein